MNWDDASKIAGILIPVAALLLAYIESRKWRRELVGKNQIDLALRIGKLAVEFRNQFEFAVSAWGDFEGRARVAEGEETPEQKYNRDERYSRQKRLYRLSEILGELAVANVEAEILFDKELYQFSQTYSVAFRKLSYAIAQHFELEEKYPDSIDEKILNRKEKMFEIVYGADKELMNQVEQATSELVKYLKTHLR